MVITLSRNQLQYGVGELDHPLYLRHSSSHQINFLIEFVLKNLKIQWVSKVYGYSNLEVQKFASTVLSDIG